VALFASTNPYLKVQNMGPIKKNNMQCEKEFKEIFQTTIVS